jgi:hypothetical protein
MKKRKQGTRKRKRVARRKKRKQVGDEEKKEEEEEAGDRVHVSCVLRRCQGIGYGKSGHHTGNRKSGSTYRLPLLSVLFYQFSPVVSPPYEVVLLHFFTLI